MELPKILNIEPQNELFGNRNNLFFLGVRSAKKPYI
tara:strand:- start:292 stop:399 length:108 start_codon:yes stop_codon:yes gene_type:complete